MSMNLKQYIKRIEVFLYSEYGIYSVKELELSQKQYIGKCYDAKTSVDECFQGLMNLIESEVYLDQH